MSAKPAEPVTLSVVVPAFQEEENVEALVTAITGVLAGAGESFEIVIVDDGSRDRTWSLVAAAAARDPRVRGLRLSRNFGHQAAVTAGLEHARGAAVAVIDADLQDPPRVLLDMLALWRQGNQVVYGVRRGRKENALLVACYRAFYRILTALAEVPMPLDAGDFCLMDRRAVDLLNALPERRRFVRGLRAWIGLRQVGLEYERAARRAGEPKYTLGGLIALATDGFASFSIKPLQAATRIGFGMAALACLSAVVYALLRLCGVGTWPLGFASLFIGMLLLFGVQFILIGILGEYVGRIHDEVKGRPTYLIGEELGAGGDERADG